MEKKNRFSALYFVMSAFLCMAALSRAVEARLDSEQITSQTLVKAGPAFNFAREEKIKGFYLSGIFSKARRVEGMKYEEILAKMKEVGINVMMPKHVVPPDYGDPGVYLDRMAEAYTAAEKHNLILLPWIDFLGNLEARLLEGNTEIARFVDEQGREYKKTPSPLDEKYWELAVGSRMAEVARMSLEHHIQGLLFDNEMYGADFNFYERVGTYCYSDKAFGGFVASRGLDATPEDLTPGERRSWLEEKGLMEAYRQYYRGRVVEILSEIRGRVHEINPDFILGFYNYRANSPFYEALVLGLGTERMPCTLWPGTTYQTGYSKSIVDDTIIGLRDMGAHALYIPGLWVSQFHVDNFSAHIYRCGEKSAGYWIYGVYTLFEEWARARRTTQLADVDAYWESFRVGNEELLKRVKNPAYETSLALDDTLVIYTDFSYDQHRLPFDLKPLDKDFTLDEPLAAMRRVRIRFNATYLLHVNEGEIISFKLSCQRLGRLPHGLTFELLSPSGREVLTGLSSAIPFNGSREVEITAEETGVYVLICDMGRNTATLETANRVSFLARWRLTPAHQRRVNFKRPRGNLYFWVPEGEEKIEIEVRGEGANELVKAAIINPEGRIVEEKDKISGGYPHIFSVKRKRPMKGEVWCLNLERPSEGYFGDVVVIFPYNIPNVFSFHPRSLLIPTE